MPTVAISDESGQTSFAGDVPSASAFPTHPAAWYFFCQEDDLANGPQGRRIFGRDVVAFRTARRHVVVLDARCSHLGADLACGKVVGETIECPFHNWRFGDDGLCREIPATKQIPAFARQRSYPVAVRHGAVFVFNGSEATYPLPFFAEEEPENFVSARAFSYTADAGWPMVTSQGFDTQHFESVHDRRPLRPPELQRVSPFALRNRMDVENVGTSVRDRLLRTFVGPAVSMEIWNWGGVNFSVQAKFLRVCSRFLIFFRPLEDGRTHFDVLVFTRRGLPALTLPVRRWFTRQHLVSEAMQVRGTQYRPSRLIPVDAGMIECFRWLASIPQNNGQPEPDASLLEPSAIAKP
ncbi:hypothetical protein BH11VER1_BH11VER1_15180 [soil metagenome]